MLRWERALLALAAEENETKKDKIDATGTGAGMYDVHVTCLAVLYITLPLTSQTLFLWLWYCVYFLDEQPTTSTSAPKESWTTARRPLTRSQSMYAWVCFCMSALFNVINSLTDSDQSCTFLQPRINDLHYNGTCSVNCFSVWCRSVTHKCWRWKLRNPKVPQVWRRVTWMDIRRMDVRTIMQVIVQIMCQVRLWTVLGSQMSTLANLWTRVWTAMGQGRPVHMEPLPHRSGPRRPYTIPPFQAVWENPGEG